MDFDTELIMYLEDQIGCCIEWFWIFWLGHQIMPLFWVIKRCLAEERLVLELSSLENAIHLARANVIRGDSKLSFGKIP